MTTNTQHGTARQKLSSFVNAYILDAIEGSGYGKELVTDTEKLQFVADCYKSEYAFPENLQRYGSHQNSFANWIQGLPSSFGIDYENYRIIELAKEWGSLPAVCDDRQEDKILDNWWNFIACKTIQLMAKHKIKIY